MNQSKELKKSFIQASKKLEIIDEKRGQAALFDAIMFLLFVSGSMAMAVVFANDYGRRRRRA